MYVPIIKGATANRLLKQTVHNNQNVANPVAENFWYIC